MNKSKFRVGKQYSYQGRSEPLTYLGQSKQNPEFGMFKSPLNEMYHNEYRNMDLFKQPEPQYPNPPRPHCEERIAFAKGANIEGQYRNHTTWHDDPDPSWNPNSRYRVKVEKTKDDLRIEELERRIAEDMRVLDKHKKELADLKPTVHY
jgi:hypothetical protein